MARQSRELHQRAAALESAPTDTMESVTLHCVDSKKTVKSNLKQKKVEQYRKYFEKKHGPVAKHLQ